MDITVDGYRFRPNLTPHEMFSGGVYGGCYWRPLKSALTGKMMKHYHKKYPCLKGIPESIMVGPCSVEKNHFKAHSGTTYEAWIEKGWIKPYHEYGWIHWYTDFWTKYHDKSEYDEKDPEIREYDIWQIKRWLSCMSRHILHKTKLSNVQKQLAWNWAYKVE